MFLVRQYFKDDNRPKSIYRLNAIPFNIAKRFFVLFKIKKHRRAKVSKSQEILEKIDKKTICLTPNKNHF